MIRYSLGLGFIAIAGLALAQVQPPPSQPSQGGWRRVGDPPPSLPVPPQQQSQSQDPSEPIDRSDQFGQPIQDNPPAPPEVQQPPRMNDRPPSARPAYGLPPEVTLQPGTFVTIRTNEPLSSDHNQPGDTFTGALAQPIVVDGVVVAQRGQTVYGRVAEAMKARSGNSSRLGIELTSLTLADGTQVPVRSQLVARQGTTTPGEAQAGTIVGTTAVGAAIGAAADWGRGAAIGAGVGAAAGVVGVLLTRNHPTVVYPETALTFRVESPVRVAIAHAPQAFRYVGPEEYERGYNAQMQPRPVGPRPPAVYYGPAYYPYYPYYWGPSFSFYVGRGPGYYYGRGYFRRW
jgi:hypothetical protein